jgi:hypothetical protein
MGSISYDPEFSDVDNDAYVSGTVAVTSVAVEAKVGTTRLTKREGISITNKGPDKVYYGPLGVTDLTGDYLAKDQNVSFPFGDQLGIYVIVSAGKNATVIVQEFA